MKEIKDFENKIIILFIIFMILILAFISALIIKCNITITELIEAI